MKILTFFCLYFLLFFALDKGGNAAILEPDEVSLCKRKPYLSICLSLVKDEDPPPREPSDSNILISDNKIEADKDSIGTTNSPPSDPPSSSRFAEQDGQKSASFADDEEKWTQQKEAEKSFEKQKEPAPSDYPWVQEEETLPVFASKGSRQSQPDQENKLMEQSLVLLNHQKQGRFDGNTQKRRPKNAVESAGNRYAEYLSQREHILQKLQELDDSQARAMNSNINKNKNEKDGIEAPMTEPVVPTASEQQYSLSTDRYGSQPLSWQNQILSPAFSNFAVAPSMPQTYATAPAQPVASTANCCQIATSCCAKYSPSQCCKAPAPSLWPSWWGTGVSPFNMDIGTGLRFGWPFGGANFGTGFGLDLG